MDVSYFKKKYAADKVALLVLFIIGLLGARLIVKSKRNKPLKAGAELVTKIKDEGLLNIIGDEDRRAFFMISNAKNIPIGFMMDVLTVAEPNSETLGLQTSQPLNIRAANYLYLKGQYAQERVGVFQGQSNLAAFIWKSKAAYRTARVGTTITLDIEGVMTVTKSARHSEEKTYLLDNTAIPDVFMELLFAQMLDSGHKKILVDIIKDDGEITPILVRRITADNAGYLLNVDFLDDRGFSEQIYLDDQKRISKTLLQQQSIFILERTSVEDILRQFPERTDYILQKSRLPEH